MKVEIGKVISISYELRKNDAFGELMEVMDYNWPLCFYFGGGAMLESFESALYGKTLNDNFEFILQPNEAYGPKEISKIIELRAEEFIDEQGEILTQVGAYVQVKSENNAEMRGKVLQISPEKVLIDCNHEMAGKTLHFKGVILNVRDASVDEHIQKRYIEPDGLRF